MTDQPIHMEGIDDAASFNIPGPGLQSGAFSYLPRHYAASLVERVTRLSIQAS
ncbi:hypothetical protein OVY48_18365 [Sphingobium sp. SA2]|uniref:hypothetical protein n=1 Tax=Sphingobium sp. SA2 TaxID=1524832 RepID=UPI0028C26A49|nr:hypothetical protein [Sphingobium sp. SA2]MDT7535377.1 hypothetical protein [Sphingobium sp. SA2]